MAPTRPDQRLVPSVLNRLLQADTPIKVIGRTPAQIRKNIEQDLEDLLNTRKRPISIPESLDKLEDSLVNYGIPDPIGYDLSSNDRIETFREEVETAIKNFERRFLKVSVTVGKGPEIPDRILRFRIEASMRILQMPEMVVFSMDVEPATRKIDVKAIN